MLSSLHTTRAAMLVALCFALRAPSAAAQTPSELVLEEATIASIHAALEDGRIRCRDLVARYLDRVEAYDDRGPAINAILATNPWALEVAAALDRRQARSGLVGPLHCIPVIVKDNFDTADMPTTAGSLSLEGSLPPADAFVVRRLREAGAIVLAKSNLHEFARGTTTISSLGGQTRNPYDLDHVPSGSSGGTAAAVAANMGAVGIGTETGRSIRSPAGYNALVGIAPTEGLLSRSGIIPLSAVRDRPGPLTRTVADAARLLEVMAGYDPADPVTARAPAGPPSYVEHLRVDALEGARIGVLRAGFVSDEEADPEVIALVEQAVRDLEAEGAVVVDPVAYTVDLDSLMEASGGGSDFRWALDRYLAHLGPHAPATSLEDIVASGLIHASLEASFAESAAEPPFDPEDPEYVAGLRGRRALREALTGILEAHDLDALVYPMNVRTAQRIGEEADAGARFSPNSGLPAVVVPAGFTAAGLPASLEFLGRAYDEGTLIGLAFAYEQATRWRRPPATAPRLPVSEQAQGAGGR